MRLPIYNALGCVVLAAACLWIVLPCLGSLTFEWTPPAGFVPNGYFLFHGTVSGMYTDHWNAGSGTNFTLNAQLPEGPNYFVLVDYLVENNGTIEMSSWDNEVVATNAPAVDLEVIVMTATNLSPGAWRPWSTTHLTFLNDGGAQRFFRVNATGGMRTNKIILPTTP